MAREHQLDSDSIYRGDSDTLTFTINPKEIKAGTHNMSFSVETNSSDGDFVVNIQINTTAAPAIHFSNYYLIDDKSEDRRCDNTNNDGRFNAGETVALNFEVKNNGSLEAVGGYAHLALLKEEVIYDPNEDACELCGWIHEEAAEFSHLLRKYRNLVHPWEQLERADETPSKDDCGICWQTVRAALYELERIK